MSNDDEHEFFRLRKQAKTYISRIFTYNSRDIEPKRNIKMVIEGSDQVHFGEINGAMCLRITGNTRKTQVSAIVTQDEKTVRRLTLQTFKNRSGDWIQTYEKDEFTFRSDEFERLCNFLSSIKFIDLSNEQKFQIEDISTRAGPKAIIDASDQEIIQRFKSMSDTQRVTFFQGLQGSLTDEEVNLVLGRRKGIEEFEEQFCLKAWTEAQWQNFFEREQWVFGYGLDYRVMKQFDREMAVGSGGVDNQNKPVVDFLMNFTDYTVLVEIKKPDTPIFRERRGGRAGTWAFSTDFIDAVSQIIEQKAEWSSFSQIGEHHNKAGSKTLDARTKNAKCILVIGSTAEFENSDTIRSANIKRDTFELFRRENRSIDIVTFDELLERARFITRHP